MKTEKQPGEQTISRAPFPASKKVFVKGQIHEIEVAMREVSLSDTQLHGRFGETEPNAPVTLYDTSGPYTDTSVEIDIKKGLSRLRKTWISDRGDVEQLDHISSDYGNERANDKKLDHLRFAHISKPFRAKPGRKNSPIDRSVRGTTSPPGGPSLLRSSRRRFEAPYAKNWAALKNPSPARGDSDRHSCLRAHRALAGFHRRIL